MEELEKRIEALRIELEWLYIRAKTGEAGMEEAIRISAELDRLILERTLRFGGEERGAAEC